MVPLARLELAHLSILDFESSASTNFTTEAHKNFVIGLRVLQIYCAIINNKLRMNYSVNYLA